MQPMSPLDPDVDAFYEAYHLLARAVNDPAKSGARHLQDTYFEFDDVASLTALTSGDAR